MAKSVLSVRISEGAAACLDRLTTLYGERTPAVSAAIVSWATTLEESWKDVAAKFDRREWNAIAQAMGGPWEWYMLEDRPVRGSAIAAEVIDAVRLDTAATADERTQADTLGKKLWDLSHAQTMAVILAVNRFWGNNQIDANDDEWWLPGFVPADQPDNQP